MAELGSTKVYGDLTVSGTVNVPAKEGATTTIKPVGSNAVGDRTISTANPSGGKDGDIWLQY
jgi:hypothetical protein